MEHAARHKAVGKYYLLGWAVTIMLIYVTSAVE
jgi:hypothetical protein